MNSSTLNVILTCSFQISVAQSAVYVIAAYCAKMIVVVLLLRLFGVSDKCMISAWIIIVTWTMWSIIDICLIVCGCHPEDKEWEPWIPGHCVSLQTIGVASGYINIAYDVMIWCLPIPKVLRLQLARRMKLALLAVFATGVQ